MANLSYTIKYTGKGYLDEKMNPIANIAALEALDTTKYYKEGMKVTVLDDGTGNVAEFRLTNGEWVKEEASSVDLSDYAKKSDIPSISGKADVSAVTALEAAVAGKADAGHNHDSVYAKKADIPDVSEFVTSAGVETQIAAHNFLTDHQDISGKADATAVTADIAAAIAAETARTESTYVKGHQDISGKADKVSGAVAGNIATLDANGNLVDSGINPADIVVPAIEMTGDDVEE